ncbi:MAG TPA: universal stress protein [Candidatus Udaeobacter sp.]|nr:universal stress protein [Candidatus Udaeobacter sp.]
MVRKVLIASDGSKGADKALAEAVELAKRVKAELHMVCVEELPRLPATIDEVVEEKREADHRFAEVIAQARMLAKSERVKLETHVISGHAVPAIVEFIKRQRFDLLVVGFMGHSALYNRLIGSTTDRLVELAPCSVLVVK